MTRQECPDWRKIINQIWEGKTVQHACEFLGEDYSYVESCMSPQIRYFIIDVSMVANVREEILEGQAVALGSYKDFESRMTEEIEKAWKKEIDPEVKEMLRLEILRQRIFAKNYWEKIGKEVPTRIKFSEE